MNNRDLAQELMREAGGEVIEGGGEDIQCPRDKIRLNLAATGEKTRDMTTEENPHVQMHCKAPMWER